MLLLVATTALLAASCSGGDIDLGAEQPPVTQPNVVFIMLDDLRGIELGLGFGRSLDDWDSAVEAELVDAGTTFENFLNVTPLCCPSRASFLTGRFPHSHGIYVNSYRPSGGNGGWRRFWEQNYEDDTIGTWMQDAGYDTALVGKFLNGYPDDPDSFLPVDYVPPGWDEFYGTHLKAATASYYDFVMNENGKLVHHGGGAEPAYLTDVESAHALDYLQRRAGSESPFFLFVSNYAPHAPTEPAPRHAGAHDEIQPPNPPSFNEADLADKPAHIIEGFTERPGWWGKGSKGRLDMTLAVDEMVRDIVDELEAQGILDETYIFLVSDNGLLAGEHGLGGKSAPYEESIRTPMLVRGPGVDAGTTVDHLVGNVDIAPTFLDLAGASIPGSVDGESLLGPILGRVSSGDWRDAMLIELRATIDSPNQSGIIPRYSGVRTQTHTYIEYSTGEVELYDLAADPFQLDSIHGDASADLIAELKELLDGLRDCSASGCAAGARAGEPNEPGIIHYCYYEDCEFTGTAPEELANDVIGYRWDFGDGLRDEGETVSHTYANDGLYPVTVTLVHGDGGESATRYVPANVTRPITFVTTIDPTVLLDAGRVNAPVTAVDGRVQGVAGAEVVVDFSVNGTRTEQKNSTTNAKGKAAFSFDGLSSGDQIEVCVTGILDPGGLEYDPSRNSITCLALPFEVQEVFDDAGEEYDEPPVEDE